MLGRACYTIYLGRRRSWRGTWLSVLVPGVGDLRWGHIIDGLAAPIGRTSRRVLMAPRQHARTAIRHRVDGTSTPGGPGPVMRFHTSQVQVTWRSRSHRTHWLVETGTARSASQVMSPTPNPGSTRRLPYAVTSDRRSMSDR